MIYKFSFPYQLAGIQEVTITAEIEFHEYEPATRTEPATAAYYEVIGIYGPGKDFWSKEIFRSIWEHALDIAGDHIPEQKEPYLEPEHETRYEHGYDYGAHTSQSFREFQYLFNHAFQGFNL